MLVRDKVKNREKFTQTENQISDYILNHTREVIDMPLETLAGNLYVSKSTIIRFCKKLGFRGHKELCVQLAREMNSFLVTGDSKENGGVPFGKEDSHENVAQNILALKFQALTDTFNDLDMKQIEEAAELIFTHKKVRIYAAMEEYPIALDFQMKLTAIGLDAKISQVFGGDVLQATAQEADSIALLLSYTGKDRQLLQIAELLRKKLIPIILVTGPVQNCLAKNANVILHTSYAEETPKIGTFGSAVGIAFLMDVLYCYIFQHDFDRMYNHRMEVDNILNGDRS